MATYNGRTSAFIFFFNSNAIARQSVASIQKTVCTFLVVIESISRLSLRLLRCFESIFQSQGGKSSRSNWSCAIGKKAWTGLLPGLIPHSYRRESGPTGKDYFRPSLTQKQSKIDQPENNYKHSTSNLIRKRKVYWENKTLEA